MPRLIPAAAALLSLAGCHLLDQTDFDPPLLARAARPIPNPETRTALITIEYAKASPDYRAVLGSTIRTVEAKRPGVLYDVVSVIGAESEAVIGRGRAAEVMTAVEAAGVTPARIQLGLAIEPGRTPQQVRVYLR